MRTLSFSVRFCQWSFFRIPLSFVWLIFSWSQLFVIQLSINQSANRQFTIRCQLSFSWSFSGQSIILDAQLGVMDNATTSSLIERWKTLTSSLRRLLKYSRLLTNVIIHFGHRSEGGCLAKPPTILGFLWTPATLRRPCKTSSMQDHQACKTSKHWRPSGPK